jgi:3-hydroxyisobutyrate dehydrogenase
MAKIGFIGLGGMGTGMATRLLSTGHEVAVWNRTRSRAESLAAHGARVAASPADCAQSAEFVFSMVADDDASRQIWLGADGALATIPRGATCVECSTLSPTWIQTLGTAAAEKGCALLDAPVTGTRSHAADGQLLFLVGGDATVLESARPVLACMSRGIVYLGPLGNGARMKLINNFLCGVQAAALAEAIATAERCSLDLRQVFEVLSNGAPGSPLVKLVGQRMLDRSYDPIFHLGLMAKDLRYSLHMGAGAGLQLPVVAGALAEFERAIAVGLGELDFASVVEPLRENQPKP